MSVLDDMPPAFVEQLHAARCVTEFDHDGRRIRVTYRPGVMLTGAWIPGEGPPISEEVALDVIGRAIVSVSCSPDELAAVPGLAVAVSDAALADCVRWLFGARMRFESGQRR